MAVKIYHDEQGPFLSLWASPGAKDVMEQKQIIPAEPHKVRCYVLPGDATLKLSPLGVMMLRFLASDFTNRAYDPIASLARFLLKRLAWRYLAGWESPKLMPERAIRGTRSGISSIAEAKGVMLDKALLHASKCVIGPLGPEGRLWWGAVEAVIAWLNGRGMEIAGRANHGYREFEWAIRVSYKKMMDRAGLPSLAWLAEHTKPGMTWDRASRLVELYYQASALDRRDYASEEAMAMAVEETRRLRKRERDAEKKFSAERFLCRRDTYRQLAKGAVGDGSINPFGF